MKLAIIITQSDPETVFNSLRLASYSLKQGDEVKLFLSGRGVEIDRIADAKLDVKKLAHDILSLTRKILRLWNLIKLHKSDGSDNCRFSTMKNQYEIIREADKVIAV